MELLIWMLTAACFQYAAASHHQEGIEIQGYDPKLQNLGQHVDIPEPPVKVIRITKTFAIKVPVPYPVKIPHKVPYPVHIAKPYPVPVPQIIKVPHPVPVVQSKPLPEPNIYTHLQKSQPAPVWPSAKDNSEQSDYSGHSDEVGEESAHNNGADERDHNIVYGQPQISYGGGHEVQGSGQQHGFDFNGLQQHAPQSFFDGGYGSTHGQRASYAPQQHGNTYDAPSSYSAGYNGAPSQASGDEHSDHSSYGAPSGPSFASHGGGGNSYVAPQHGAGQNSFANEANAYDTAIQEYLKNHNLNGVTGAENGHGYSDSYLGSHSPGNSLDGNDYNRRVYELETAKVDQVSYDH